MSHYSNSSGIYVVTKCLENQVIQLLVQITTHSIILGPWIFSSIEIKASSDSKVPRFIVTRDLDASRRCVRSDDNYTMFRGIPKLIQLLNKLKLFIDTNKVKLKQFCITTFFVLLKINNYCIH